MDQRFCPNCGSTWVEPDTENAGAVAFHGGNPNQWKCNECSYTGFMPSRDPEEDSETEEGIEFQPGEKYPQVDTGFGEGYLKYLLYIALPVVLIYLIYLFLRP